MKRSRFTEERIIGVLKEHECENASNFDPGPKMGRGVDIVKEGWD